MNRIYKLKFNRKSASLIAVSELANNTIATINSSSIANSNSVHKVFVVNFLTLALTSVTLASPQGAQVVVGQATIETKDNLTTITNTPNSVINWQSFNIGKDEIVKFVQQNSNSAVLNRVVGNDISQILGSLQSNGKVFLVNPNGILFGKNATVNVQSLIASTLDISNDQFASGKLSFEQKKQATIASVLNQGLVKVNDDGTLALIGGNVENNGVLEARDGSVFLLAGNTISIADLNNNDISFKVTATNKAINLGTILAKKVTMLGNRVAHGDAGDLRDLFLDTINTDSQASSAQINAKGEVLLFAGSEADAMQSTNQSNSQVIGTRNGLVLVNATIDVSNKSGTAGKVTVLGDTVVLDNHSNINTTGDIAGSVNIGGDLNGKGSIKLSKATVLEKNQVINSSGTSKSGNVIVWGDYLDVDGTLDASSENGTAGLVETSAIDFDFRSSLVVKTKSKTGKSGEWLLDPGELFVTDESDAETFGYANTNNKNFLIKESSFSNGCVSVSTRKFVSWQLIDKHLGNNDNVTLKSSGHIQLTDSGQKEVTLANASASKSLIFNTPRVSGSVGTFNATGLNLEFDNTYSNQTFHQTALVLANTTLTNITFKGNTTTNLKFINATLGNITSTAITKKSTFTLSLDNSNILHNIDYTSSNISQFEINNTVNVGGYWKGQLTDLKLNNAKLNVTKDIVWTNSAVAGSNFIYKIQGDSNSEINAPNLSFIIPGGKASSNQQIQIENVVIRVKDNVTLGNTNVDNKENFSSLATDYSNKLNNVTIYGKEVVINYTDKPLSSDNLFICATNNATLAGKIKSTYDHLNITASYIYISQRPTINW